MPIPTPTNGISSALAVSLSGTGLVQLGTQVQNSQTTQNVAAPGTNFAAWFSGAGIPGRSFAAVPGAGTGAAGATDGTAQYGLTLSLGSKGGFNPTCAVTTTILDTQDSTIAQGSLTPVFVSYASPSAVSNSNCNPKTAATGFPVPTNSNGQVVTISGSTITAVSVGQAVIDVQFPFASNTLTNMSGDSQDPVVRQNIFAQITVQVVP
jgi:hypothetical protein